MIEMSVEPPTVPAAVSRVLTMRVANLGASALTNVVMRLDVPAGLGLEQGRSSVELPRLAAGEGHEHVLRIRPPRPGHFMLQVPNLSFRNGLGRAQREYDRHMNVVVEAADAPAAPAQDDGPFRRPDRASIFVSYRREDTKMVVVPLVRDLGRHKALRRADIFLDIRDVRAGTEWSSVLDNELNHCALLVAVIGPDWIEPRLHNSDDVVRREIATALQRRIPLLPLLVDAPMPMMADLPPDLQSLTRWHALRFDLDNYEASVKLLAKRSSEIVC